MFKLNKLQNLSTEIKTLLSNIFSLSFLQASNYVLPLITFPYLVRVLGPEYFGLLAFATATVSYFMLITEYGFNLSATRQISIHRHDIDKINEIFSSVMIIKLALMILSFFSMTLLVFTFEKFTEHWEIYFITFTIIFGQVLFPVWLFQGMEQMRYITYVQIAAKVFFVIAIFIFVDEKDDYLFVPLMTALGGLFSGLWSLKIAKKLFRVSFNFQPFEKIKFQLIEGWYLFFSSISISLYTTSISFILGIFSSNTAVGQFSAARTIIQAIKGLYIPISNALYPLASKRIENNKTKGLKFVLKISKFYIFAIFILSSLTFFLSEEIVLLLLGDQYYQSIILLKVMAFLPLLLAIGDTLSVQIMFNLGYQKEFAICVGIGAIFGLSLALISIPNFGSLGASYVLLSVEILITLILSIFVWYKTRPFFLKMR